MPTLEIFYPILVTVASLPFPQQRAQEAQKQSDAAQTGRAKTADVYLALQRTSPPADTLHTNVG